MNLKILDDELVLEFVKEDVKENIKKSLKRKTVELIYKMVYPYRNWHYDYLNACYDLRREIITWCNQSNMKIPVLMIGRLLEINFNQKETLFNICTKVLDSLTDLCLEINEEPFKSSLVVSLSTNTYPHVDSFLLCKLIGRKLFFVRSSPETVYDVLYDGLLRDFFISRIGDYYYRLDIHNPESGITVKSSSGFRNLINTPITIDFLENMYFNQYFETYQERMFIIYVHDLFRSGKIPFGILWEELCNLPIIQQFNVKN